MKIEESKYKDPYLKLIEIPGIGTIGSATIMTEVIDINRFSSYEKFHSFIGLIPSTNSSAETERVMGITKRSKKGYAQYWWKHHGSQYDMIQTCLICIISSNKE